MQDKKIAAIIKNNPLQKFVNPWFLILCVVIWMIHDSFCDGCSWVPCLFWTVKLSTVLQKNSSCPADSSVFQHLLHIWTLSSSDCMILRSIFSHGGELRGSNTSIKKGIKRSLMLQKETQWIKSQGVKTFEQDEDVQISFFFFFFSFSSALWKQ